MLNFIAKNIRHQLMQRPSERFASDFNTVNGLMWRHPVKTSFHAASGTMIADDGARRIHFCRNSRVLRYTNGIDTMLDKLARSYGAQDLTFSPGDWVVDCGANVGEFSAWVRSREPGVNVIAVEPEELEANCTDLNVFGGEKRTVRQVLWNEETTLRFYSNAETADSSVLESPSYSSVKEVHATTLDALLARFDVPRVRLLKLEAEGAEPEILAGAERSLARIEYIAADLGPERGLKQEPTVAPVVNHLLARGFELVDMRFDRVTCLFRNKASGG